MRIRREISFCVIVMLLVTLFPSVCLADEEEGNKYYIGEKVKNKKDEGYSGREKIDKDAPHYGWNLGRFYITGYSNRTEIDGNPCFLKTVGDEIRLHFELLQDIKKLNGDKDLSICEDTNGYDKHFGIAQTNFGRGALIIQHTDYQNNKKEPVLYTDFLNAWVQGADINVSLLEEGDYEVTLDYEIRKEAISVFGHTIVPTYDNYEIYFKFSIRNGNCMIYPFDVNTRGELTNSAYTENGFYLDFANSHYLDMNIKREVYADGADGLTEDVRFNKPAKEGEKFTDEGIYTITAYNKFTNQTTTKVIYVGTNQVVKAHVVTGISFNEIKQKMDQGYTISEDGTLIEPLPTVTPTVIEQSDSDIENGGSQRNIKKDSDSSEDDSSETSNTSGWTTIMLIAIAVMVCVVGIVWKALKRKKAIDAATEESSVPVVSQDNTEGGQNE